METGLQVFVGSVGIATLTAFVALGIYWLVLPWILVSKLNKVTGRLAASRQTLECNHSCNVQSNRSYVARG